MMAEEPPPPPPPGPMPPPFDERDGVLKANVLEPTVIAYQVLELAEEAW